MGRKKYIFILILLIWIKSFQAKGSPNNVGLKSKTMLEQFYEYIQGERDAMEKEMENKRFHLDKVIMKIPKKSDKTRMKRSIQKKDYNVNKIKKEIEKLKDLITILNDQKTVIDGLNSVNPKFNLTITQKELNDLRGYVKNLVGKLEKEIVDRKSVDKEILNELDNQKEIVAMLQNKKENDQINEKDEIINDVFEELKNLETHLSGLRDKSKSNENVSEKMRKSNLEEILENEGKEMNQSKLLQKLVKMVEDNNKMKKEKTFLDILFNKINENANKLENREENTNLNDRLDELKEKIDDMQNPDEIESKNLDDILKKLIKPTEEKINLKKDTKLEDLIKKLIQKLDQKSKNDEKKFNLYNCKHIQPFNYDLYPNFGFNSENYQHPNLNYQSNVNYKHPNLNYQNSNLNYLNNNLNEQNLNLFHDQFENNFNQQTINGYNTQENRRYSPKNFVPTKLNLTSTENKEDDNVLRKSKRSLSLEENLVEILKDELKNEDDNEDINEDLNANEIPRNF
ncbi:putative leucine-rich repeat-containing protein DDB_G0290503 isoform X2 [Onthophagus taurus]|uniref:putative leucine-rich repeat-containing protein DDB_G0290503 isoform X2 n=1 Tax=Onthophagus taurus TaxID=166361 RepID=UPI0039BDB3F1